MNKELLIANDYYVLVKLEPDFVKVLYPANVLIQPERKITSDTYIYHNNIMGINTKTSNNVPDYIPRVLAYMNIQYKAIGYGFEPAMVLKDNYEPFNLLDIQFNIENLELENLVRVNINHIVNKRLDLVPDKIKEGCEFLFNCFYNGDL